ncbi:MAG: hypothetical protein HC877_00390 [Thioploca sp.]|nr:hypothetical protein [Thioploca sp.]
MTYLFRIQWEKWLLIVLLIGWLPLAQAKPEFKSIPSISTYQAWDWESFTIDNDYYLAVANYNTNSKIYRWDDSKKQFVALPESYPSGSYDWEFFTIDNTPYLALANYSASSLKIYKWEGTKFVDTNLSLSSSGIFDVEFFTIGENSYLTAANYSGSNVAIIYQWKNNKFEQIQSLPNITHARDSEFFTIGNNHYLAIASDSNTSSIIYQWNENKFEPFQSISTANTAYATDMEFYTIGSKSYLAIASENSPSTSSKIYPWDGKQFAEAQAQPIPLNYLWDAEFFTVGNNAYLAVANYSNATPKIYRLTSSGLVEFQSFSGIYGRDWEFFTMGTDYYLALANGYTADSSYSTIYKFDNGVKLTTSTIPEISTCQSFDLTIKVQAPVDQAVDTVSAYLNFDPDMLQVAKDGIKPGTKLSAIVNTVDNDKGELNFVASTLEKDKPKGTFDLMTITFNATKAGKTSLVFNKTAPRKTEALLAAESFLSNADDITLVVDDLGFLNGVAQVETKDGKIPYKNHPLRIHIGPPVPETLYEVMTDEEGKFSLGAVKWKLNPGKYDVYVGWNNLLQQKQSIEIKTCETTTLNLEPLQAGDLIGLDPDYNTPTTPDNLIGIHDISVFTTYLWQSPIPKVDYSLDGQVDSKDEDKTFLTKHFDLDNSGSVDVQDAFPIFKHFNFMGVNKQGGPTVKKGLRTSTPLLAAGDRFDVTVKIEADESQAIDAIALRLGFDPSLLKANSLKASSAFDTSVNDINQAQGQVDFVAGQLGENKPSGHFEVVTVNFTVLSQDGENSLAINICDTAFEGHSLTNVTCDLAITVNEDNPSLTVIKQGNGTVTDDQEKIDCGTVCSADYLPNTTVTLTATPATGYSFTGWQGACSGTELTAEVILDNSKECIANFFKPLAVTLSHSTLTPLANGFRLNWQTGYEDNCVGFQVWRAWVADGQCWDKEVDEYQDITQLTEQLLIAKGEGSSYTFDDLSINPIALWLDDTAVEGKPSYCYGLEEVHFDGSSSFYLLDPDLEGWVPLTD